LVTVLSESAAVSFALRLSAVDITSAVPTHINIMSTARPPATKPIFTRRRVRRAIQRFAKAPNNNVPSTTRMTGAGILVDAVVSASTRAEVCS
jgi:hypothetical protein